MKLLALLLGLILSAKALEKGPSAAMIKVPEGIYKSFYKEKDQEESVKIATFLVDRYPVTNKEFLEFVKKNPEWKKSSVPVVFAGAQYLSKWPEELQISKGEEDFPVVFVSWFAAKKYCEFYGKRLLTVNEWEYVSDPANPENIEKILEWYGRPNSAIGKVGGSAPNKYGLYDMHGLVWEWVDDYASVIIKGDSRSDNDRDRGSFCGAGALNATAVGQYTTFMRFAFRSSLKGNYATENLGFRCGKDLVK